MAAASLAIQDPPAEFPITYHLGLIPNHHGLHASLNGTLIVSRSTTPPIGLITGPIQLRNLGDPTVPANPTANLLGSDVICLQGVGAVGHQNVGILDGLGGIPGIHGIITTSVQCGRRPGICALYRPLTTLMT
jgi:hypothetical protein